MSRPLLECETDCLNFILFAHDHNGLLDKTSLRLTKSFRGLTLIALSLTTDYWIYIREDISWNSQINIIIVDKTFNVRKRAMSVEHISIELLLLFENMYAIYFH